MIQAKRAIEALRSGVPNRDAVNSLGTNQEAILSVFDESLERVKANKPGRGILVGGGFGSGKSHLLQFLQHRAEAQNFVTSKVVISKETPLHDIGKVFRAAVGNTRVPGRRGSALTDIVASLRYESKEFGQFNQWVNDSRSGLNERFPATLYLLENLRDLEFTERILSFWAGDTIYIGDIKRKLKECGESSTYVFSKVLARDLAVQRFRFLSRLVQVAGYAGWVLLFDEVELIGRYSLLQRGRSYAEIERWVRGTDDERIDGVTAVLAITDDFPGVLNEKQDWDDVPNRLRASGKMADDVTAARAEIGMNIIARELEKFTPVDSAAVEKAYSAVRALYSQAYGWDAPAIAATGGLQSSTMRAYVRSWIYTWDLQRLDPSYEPEIEVTPVQFGWEEDESLNENPDEWERAES